MGRLSPLDPASFSRPELAVVTNLKLTLIVNFEKKIFHGSVDLSIRKIDPNVTVVVLDSKNLKIFNIIETQLNIAVPFIISQPVEDYGSKLTIALPPKETNDYIFSVEYETDPYASGLGWLEPEHTFGKKFPCVFSRFQITVPSNLTVVMSSPRYHKTEIGDNIRYHFAQRIPVPSYLIAIAIGAFESRQIGPRSHVWAEKEIVEVAAWEFANTEKQLQIAEEICGPYVWGIYDLLVLPPSYSYEGMENPCLTFIRLSSTRERRTLLALVAHEIAHSWTGNLVTNCNFEHFWLNEGFATFIERKIVGRLTSYEEQDFEAYCGTWQLVKELRDSFRQSNPVTSLVVNLEKNHPKHCFSTIAYEKGHLFLCYLEIIVGGPNTFEPFLRKYIDTYKYKSIHTDVFKSYFEKYFADNPRIQQINWNTWLYRSELPSLIPLYRSKLIGMCIVCKKYWLEWKVGKEECPFKQGDVKQLNASQIIQLLREILEEPPQPIQKLQAMEKIFAFHSFKNYQINLRWQLICKKANREKNIAPGRKKG